MNKPIRIFIAEENPLISETLERILHLQKEPGWELCGSSVEAPLVADLQRARIDLLIFDLVSTGSGPLSGCRRVRIAIPELRILAMSSRNDAHDWVKDAWNAGADGFVFNSSPPSEILACIQAVANGGTAFHGNRKEVERAAVANRQPLDSLSEKEHELHRHHFILGVTIKELANRWKAKANTLYARSRVIRLKLGLKDSKKAE